LLARGEKVVEEQGKWKNAGIYRLKAETNPSLSAVFLCRRKKIKIKTFTGHPHYEHKNSTPTPNTEL